eukprot:m.71317 g.71317  ORF g.71317 m.71317 type:complete len:397 (+) comp12236_c0_seq3:49-1239(+)
MAAQFSAAVQKLQNEGAYAVLAAATALEAKGQNIVHFEIGQPDFPTPKHIVEAGLEALRSGETTYCNPSGTSNLKDAIAEDVSATRNVTVKAENVVIGPGCKPGLFFCTMALLEEGDEVICPDPGFPTYTNMVEVCKATPVLVGLDSNLRCFDLDKLEAAITSKTRIIIVNSPSNPTGGVATEEDLNKIASIVKKHPKIWVFSDEIYAKLIFTGSQVAPSFLKAAEAHGILDRTIMFDGASKTYCMTGWRLGWAVMPTSLAERVHLLLTHSLGCTATFTQTAAVAALKGPSDPIDEMVAEYKKRRDYVVERLNKMPGVSCASPDGAFYAFPKVSDTGLSGSDLASELLNKAGVAVLAGTDFGAASGDYIRISYVRGMDVLKEGLDRMEKYLVERKN